MSRIGHSSMLNMPNAQSRQVADPQSKDQVLLVMDNKTYRIPLHVLAPHEVKMPAEKQELMVALRQGSSGKAPPWLQISRSATVARIKG